MAVPIVLCKDGVTMEPVTPASMVIDAAVVLCSRDLGIPLTISCGTEGHGLQDPHTLGRARDIRTSDLPPKVVRELFSMVRAYTKAIAPGVPFTTLYEVPSKAKVRGDLLDIATINSGASAEHIHVQLAIGQVYPKGVVSA